MGLADILALTIHVIAIFASLWYVRSVRNWRFLLLAGIAVTMCVRQALIMKDEGPVDHGVFLDRLEDVPGLLAACLILAGIIVFGRLSVRQEKDHARIRGILSSASDVDWQVSAKGEMEYFSNRLPHVRDDEVVRLMMGPRRHEGEGHEAVPAWQDHAEIIARREPLNDKVTEHSLPDGRSIYLQSNAHPIFSPTGEFQGYRGASRDVTKQVLAERRLRLTQEAVDSSITAVALLDGDNRISYANRALLRLWGAGDDEEVLGLPATHLWCEPAWFRAGLSQLGDAGRWIGESVACRLDGSTFCGRVAATVVNDQEGSLLARVLFIQDVSEERRVVEELRVSEARLTRAQEIAHMASWDRDLKDGTYTWSKGIYRIFGLPEGDPDRFLADLRHVHPDDRKRLAAAMTESIENPSSPYSVEYRIILPDGTVRTVYSRGELVTDPDGKPLRFSGFIQDITDRARVQAAFADSEARVRQILQSAAVGLVTTDAAGLIQSFNPAAERIFGYTADEVRGTSIALLAEDPDGHHDLITAPPLGEDGTTGTPPHRELVGHRKNGDAVPIEMAVSRMEIRGETTLIATILDVSERRAAEDRLRQAQKMETVGQLTGGVAHDFNNVLMALQLNLEAVQEEVSADPEAAECIRAGLHAVQRGSELTSRLLAFSRQQPLQPIVTDVNALILQTMRLLDRTLEESVRVETSLVGGLWPIEVDQGQFANAIINLALNARDAMPQGGTLFLDTRNLTLDADNPALAEGGKAGDYVRIAVGDTGTGIPPEVLQRVFEPFFTTKEVGKGSGLGLSMVYGFVKQSGGHIHIDTADGRGTTISLYFPRVAAVPKALQPDARAGAATGRGEVILLVEDDTIVRAALVRQLGRLGYAVQGVRNGIEALRLLDRGAVPDLLITDVVLPEGMSGVEVSRAVRSRHPDCRTLYVSGYSDREITHEGRLDAGVVLLSKPFPRELLAAKVRELLDDVRAA